MSEPKGPPPATADEAIGRPQDWQEGRYQRAGESEQEMVNDPEETRSAPEDPMGNQTPPRRPGPLRTDTPPDENPGQRAVTLEDYTGGKP
jgi:hypothetical protein